MVLPSRRRHAEAAGSRGRRVLARGAELGLEAAGALAQGALALVLGTLVRALGGGSRSAADAMGMTWMSRVWAAWTDPLVARGASVASVVALVGLALVLVRGTSTVLLARAEVREAARRAADARLRVLGAALRSPARTVVSIGAAITWPAEIELGARASRARRGAIAQLAALALVVLALDASLAAIVLAVLAPFAALLRPVRRALRRAQARAAEGSIEMIDASRDLVEHAAVWATCGGGATACARVEALSREGARLSSRAAAGQALASASNEVLAALAIVVLVSVFAPGASFARPALVPVLVALVSTYRPLRDLAETGGAIDRGRAAEARVEALEPPAAEAPVRARPWGGGPLVARGLAVDVGSDVARAGIDLEVGQGDVVAVVGPPGSGKSAILEAIVGVRPMRGRLRHGALDLAAAGVGPAERPVAWVPPSPPVLPGTLAENLAPDAPRDPARLAAAREVLRALGDRELSALPDDALLGPRGRRPSSGESQRLALARALASSAPVLVLDEPTANLDEIGERRAIEVLRAAASAGTRGIVLVTHRAAPLALATGVIDLDQGSGSKAHRNPSVASRSSLG